MYQQNDTDIPNISSVKTERELEQVKLKNQFIQSKFDPNQDVKTNLTISLKTC